ncbi:uncharacterized protein [Haliotis cracherodii]|uniref:uncharacterized protein n=1 Tax=Haliotis cracherodii TaxID=6455 RepID=UPI0039EAAF07
MAVPQKDSNPRLDENLTHRPVGRVDIRSLYQRRPPCIMQIEKSLEDIEATVLHGGLETIKTFPKNFPAGEAYVNLKTRLNELPTMENVGLAYIAKSLPATANMDIKYRTPVDVILDICLIRQGSPAVVLSVVTDMPVDMKLAQRYTSAVSKELTRNVRRFTTVTFNSLYGLLHEKDLMSKESFESSLSRIEKERSRLCVPDSLSMNRKKYKHVVRAFLSSVAVTTFVKDEKEEALWFLTRKQFCILTQNIDHTEVHVDTCPASGGGVLSLTVAQRLQKLGPTLLISDDPTLVESARKQNIDSKTFNDILQSDLMAEEEDLTNVVIYHVGGPCSSQTTQLPQLLSGAYRRWVFHRQKGMLADEDGQQRQSLLPEPATVSDHVCGLELTPRLKVDMALSEKDSKRCLDENLTHRPYGRVDIRSLYQRRPPCIMQIEKSLEDIEDTVLHGELGIKTFPKNFPEGEASLNMMTRLNELSTVGNVGLAYIAKSLPATANMDIKYLTPGDVILDICLIRQDSPTVVLSVVADMPVDVKLAQRYTSAVSKELTKNVRRYTTVTFNSIYGLLHEKDLASKESFESTLSRIEKERSRLCVPDSLSMNRKKYKHVVRAFLSSVAVTTFVNSESEETLWFLTRKQFCILTQNIDHTEVHVDTCPASGGGVLSLTVAQRLQKLGRTLLISDDPTLVESARKQNIDSKTFNDILQSDLMADKADIMNVVIHHVGEPCSSQIPQLPQLLSGAHRRWVFHRQKGMLADEDGQQSQSLLPKPATVSDHDGSTGIPVTMADKGKRSSFLDREIRMVLVGKTGVGKSETGNTIAGARKMMKIFTSLARAISVTKKCKQHSFKRFGYDLQLIDVPGFGDTVKSHDDIKEEIMKCVAMSSPGIHAILFIVRVGRFTEEDTNTLERFLRCFGEESKRFVIIVFTGKDDLEADNDTLDNYLGDCPVTLKNFVFDVSRRCIAVNNRGTDPEKEKFTRDLINMIKSMVDANGGRCYTNEMYERCEAELQEAEMKEKLGEKMEKQLEEKLKQEAAAYEEKLQSQHLKMQELEKQLQQNERRSKEDEENQLRERLKALVVRQNEEAKRKCLEEERKREEAEENMRKEIQKLKDLERKMEEEYERRKEDLQREEARKQIREKVEEGNTSYLESFVGWVADKLTSVWPISS